MTLTGRARKMG